MTAWAERTDADRAEAVKVWTRDIPLDFNGYCAVAMRAIRLRADLVQVGDVLVLADYVTPVTQITARKVEGNGHALHFGGDLNVIRFPHELVSVLRRQAAHTA